MRYLLLSLTLILSLINITNADYYKDNLEFCSILDWASLIWEDWTELWKLSSNKYDSDSISNKYWTFWSKYDSDSIWNKYWTFWSKYSSYSPWNKYSNEWPIIIKWNNILWRLTINKYSEWYLNAFNVLRCFIELSDERFEPFIEHYTDSKSNSYSNTNYNITPSNSSNCWVNSSKQSDWKCWCDIWYIWENYDDANNLDCEKKTIYNTCTVTQNIYLWSDYKCYCNSWYLWDSNKNECSKIKTGIELCKESYWNYSTSNNIKNNKWTYNCDCEKWYTWNSNITNCIKVVENNNKNIEVELNNKVNLILKTFDKVLSKYSETKRKKAYEGYINLLSNHIDKIKEWEKKDIITALIIWMKKKIWTYSEDDQLWDLLNDLLDK